MKSDLLYTKLYNNEIEAVEQKCFQFG